MRQQRSSTTKAIITRSANPHRPSKTHNRFRCPAVSAFSEVKKLWYGARVGESMAELLDRRPTDGLACPPPLPLLLDCVGRSVSHGAAVDFESVSDRVRCGRA